VETTSAPTGPLPRWAAYAGLWLLTCTIFGTQLYLAGYVTPWPRALAAEAIYWLSWWVLAPPIFWWCRRLRNVAPGLRASGVAVGAVAAVFLAPLIAQLLGITQEALHLCVGDCAVPTVLLSVSWLMLTVRVAALNLTVYAGIVLGWHAVSYYREARDREMQAVQLESLLHQAQVEALRSQLNPHFLFNTLHSIAELVHHDPKLAEQLIVRLGELLRQVLETSRRPEISLEQELEFIRGYLDIEQMRLGDRLRVNWEVAPDALSARVPSLILQPLVENAIQHGIAAVATPGTLAIRARREAGFLRVDIADSGPGLSKETATRPQGIGIANTRARLHALYGERQGLELRQESGLVVSLRIPADA